MTRKIRSAIARREAYSICASVLRGYIAAGPDWPKDKDQEEILLVEKYISDVANKLEVQSWR